MDQKELNNQKNVQNSFEPSQNKKPKKLKVFVIVLVLILVCLFGWVGFRAYKNNKGLVSLNPVISPQANKILSNQAISGEENKLLPADFPREYIPIAYSHITVIDNFPPQNGAPFAIKLLAFTPTNTAYAESKAYYEKNGWTIMETKDRGTNMLSNSFSAKKDNVFLNLYFSTGGENACEVSISVIKK